MHKIKTIIEDFFVSRDWKYDLKKVDESDYIFSTGAQGNERVGVKIYVPNKQTCLLLHFFTKFEISDQMLSNLYHIINKQNRSSNMVKYYFEKGWLNFEIGINLAGIELTMENFASNFDLLLDVADNESAQIYKSVMLSDANNNASKHKSVSGLKRLFGRS